MSLEVNRAEYETPCDGCGKRIAPGELLVTNIESCCGSGCVRSLCPDCVRSAFDALNRHELKEVRVFQQITHPVDALKLAGAILSQEHEAKLRAHCDELVCAACGQPIPERSK